MKFYKTLNKSSLTPPNWVFSFVWPVLYVMMFISLSLVWNNKKCFPYCNAITFFLIQLGFNLIWTTLFFKLQRPLLALIDILLILFFTIVTFTKFININKTAGYLLLPYLLWLSFALYLNTYIVINN